MKQHVFVNILGFLTVRTVSIYSCRNVKRVRHQTAHYTTFNCLTVKVIYKTCSWKVDYTLYVGVGWIAVSFVAEQNGKSTHAASRASTCDIPEILILVNPLITPIKHSGNYKYRVI
jgi:hypothetical protein